MILAASKGDSAIVKLLDAFHADPYVVTKNGLTALKAAEMRQHSQVASLLIQSRAKFLIAAVNSGDSKVTKRLFQAGANSDVRDEYGFTLLTIATAYGDVEIVKVLLEAGADSDLKDGNGNAPLMHSAQ